MTKSLWTPNNHSIPNLVKFPVIIMSFWEGILRDFGAWLLGFVLIMPPDISEVRLWLLDMEAWGTVNIPIQPI